MPVLLELAAIALEVLLHRLCKEPGVAAESPPRRAVRAIRKERA